jgi:glycosyltransferase involved in cell wall biosynthesis
MHLMSRHLANLGINTIILTPFSEDKNNVTDVDVNLIPSTISRIGLSSIAYKIARKLASSSKTSRFFLSDLSINRMVENIRNGMYHILKKKKFHLLHAVQPIAGLACGPIAKQFNIPIVTDLHNIWPEELATQGLINRDDSIYKRLHDIEQTIIDSSDAITVVSEFMRRYIIQNYSVAKKSIVVVPSAGFFPDILPTTREINVVYTGSVSYREHVDLFAESIPFVKNPASFFISNVGDSLDQVKKITTRSGYPKVNYMWFLKREEVIDFLIRSKIGILTSYNDISRQLGPPAKLFEYMSCGVPIVGNDVGGWSKMIEKEKIGLLTEENPRNFAESIDTLLNNNSQWYDMHRNAIELIKTKYNWKTNAQNLLIPLYNTLLS